MTVNGSAGTGSTDSSMSRRCERNTRIASTPVIEVFQQLVEAAVQYKHETGRYLQIWGELGELYAEIKFGLKRHRAHSQGSDGKIGDDFIEVKTISPEKGKRTAHVKRAGNFNVLLIVKIDEHFEFQAKRISRKALGKGTGKRARFNWPDDSGTADHELFPTTD